LSQREDSLIQILVRRAASPTCNTTTITNWASNISAFIQSIDKNHLVAIGDEGFFNEPGSHNFDFVYQYVVTITLSFLLVVNVIISEGPWALTLPRT
jgi:endo-1,4-beta-mannosidase